MINNILKKSQININIIMNNDNNNNDNHRGKKHNLQKRARPTIYYAYAYAPWLNAESIHRLLSSCHCIMLICQRRRTNEGFHKWSASENEKLHYTLMKLLSSSSSILKGARRDFPFAWCGATGMRIYPSPLRLLAKKKKKSQTKGRRREGEMEKLTPQRHRH